MVHVLQKVVATGWLLGTVCLVAPIISQHLLVPNILDPDKLKETLYTTLSRPVWSLGVSWVIFACVSGYGGKYCKGH